MDALNAFALHIFQSIGAVVTGFALGAYVQNPEAARVFLRKVRTNLSK